jgi:hypothetical protein
MRARFWLAACRKSKNGPIVQIAAAHIFDGAVNRRRPGPIRYNRMD